MEKKFYKEYYHLERNHWWFKARLQILRSLIINKISSRQNNLKILNVGAATGATSLMLNEFGIVTSLEYDKDCCEYLESKAGIVAINANLTNLPFQDNTYDMICGFDVIEHIEDDNKALSEIYRVLKPHGNVILTVPAFSFLWSQHDEINHHFRRYNKQNFRNLLRNNKIKITYDTYFNFWLFVPISLTRFFLRLLPRSKSIESSGSDNEIFQSSNFINSILFRIFLQEKLFLKSGLKFPFGVSFLAIGHKMK